MGMPPTVGATVLTWHTQKTAFRFPQGDPWGFFFSWGRLLDSAQGAIQVSLVPASGRPLPSSLPNPDLDHHPSLARRCIVMSLVQIDWQRVRGRLRSRSGLLWTGSLFVGLALGAPGRFPGQGNPGPNWHAPTKRGPDIPFLPAGPAASPGSGHGSPSSGAAGSREHQAGDHDVHRR